MRTTTATTGNYGTRAGIVDERSILFDVPLNFVWIGAGMRCAALAALHEIPFLIHWTQ